MRHKNAVWHDRKRNALGLPWTFTVYELDEERLFVDTGFFNMKDDEIRLYRITDITMTRSLWQRLIGTGTLHCDSADATMTCFDIKNIKHCSKVRDMLSDYVEKARMKSRVYAHENVNSVHHGGPDGMPPMGAPMDMDGDGIPDMPPMGMDAADDDGEE